jgi:hypothetical protein
MEQNKTCFNKKEPISTKKRTYFNKKKRFDHQNAILCSHQYIQIISSYLTSLIVEFTPEKECDLTGFEWKDQSFVFKKGNNTEILKTHLCERITSLSFSPFKALYINTFIVIIKYRHF